MEVWWLMILPPIVVETVLVVKLNEKVFSRYGFKNGGAKPSPN